MISEVSNPFSTGSGGSFFEAKVQASFLFHLLIGGRIPCLPKGRVQSVRLQGKQAGFATDDVVVTIQTETGNDCRLLAQVKHRAAIRVGDNEFSDALASAWADFNNPSAFLQGQDALALITGPQSDKTLQHVRPILDWARTTSTISDIDERQFKDLVWREYVENALQAQGGMRIKRSQCLLAISVERARRMSLFVSSVGCDTGALQELVNDSILIESSAGGFAPAHDVLEDWSVARFIAQEFEAKASDPLRFLDAVGTEPAMRRGFRLWLSEALTSSGHELVMDFVLSVFQHAGMPLLWHDEIAVAVLQSDSANEFINRAEALLLDKGKIIYKRLIHVLRTACMRLKA